MHRDSEVWKVVIESEETGIMVKWASNEEEACLLKDKYTNRLGRKLIYCGHYALPVQLTQSGVVDFLNKETPEYDNGNLKKIFEAYILDPL